MIRDELDQADRAACPCPELPLQNGAPILHHGGALLTFLLREGEAYGWLTDDELVWADYAACYAVTAPEITVLALQRISAVRHRIAASLRVRAAERVDRLAHIVPTTANTPPEGPLARLVSAPTGNPPAGVHIRF